MLPPRLPDGGALVGVGEPCKVAKKAATPGALLQFKHEIRSISVGLSHDGQGSICVNLWFSCIEVSCNKIKFVVGLASCRQV